LYGFLGQRWVQAALGVPVNYTRGSSAVSNSFGIEGDFARGDSPRQIATLLEKGVKVALVYGDRDYACNWIGGERNSLRINYTGTEEFKSAGYQPIFTNPLAIGGQVRQYGNYSFSRVYQAGHEGKCQPVFKGSPTD
jgi:carboxypeptidase C (cathepsin A)